MRDCSPWVMLSNRRPTDGSIPRSCPTLGLVPSSRRLTIHAKALVESGFRPNLRPSLGVRKKGETLATLWKKSAGRASVKKLRRVRTAKLSGSTSMGALVGFEGRTSERVLDGAAGKPSAAYSGGPDGGFGDPATGFHLIDTTMMYAPRSGGVKRYL